MTRNIETKAALGEIPLEMLSDMGSIPIISTINKKMPQGIFFVIYHHDTTSIVHAPEFCYMIK